MMNIFRKRWKRPSGADGFTLLEVLIALAVLALVLTAVLQLQTQSIEMSAVHKEMVVAGLLAQDLIAEADIGEFPEVGEVSGDFRLEDEEFEEYAWTKEVAETIFEGVNELTVIISRQIGKDEEPREILSVTRYLVRPGATVKLRGDLDSGQYKGTEIFQGFQDEFENEMNDYFDY